MRDWLLVGLSFATGIYEAICFLTFGKVFTAAQTGNLVLLGIGVAGTREPAGPNPVTVVISLAAFAAGAALAMPILKAFDGDQERHTMSSRCGRARCRSRSPSRSSCRLASSLCGSRPLRPPVFAYILMALSALALGLQANTIRSLHVPDVSTTAFTAAYIDLFSGLATWKLTAHSAQRLTATVVGIGRRCPPRRLDAPPRAPVRTGRAGGRNGRRHRDRLGGPEAACHLRPGR